MSLLNISSVLVDIHLFKYQWNQPDLVKMTMLLDKHNLQSHFWEYQMRMNWFSLSENSVASKENLNHAKYHLLIKQTLTYLMHLTSLINLELDKFQFMKSGKDWTKLEFMYQKKRLACLLLDMIDHVIDDWHFKNLLKHFYQLIVILQPY